MSTPATGRKLGLRDLSDTPSHKGPDFSESTITWSPTSSKGTKEVSPLRVSELAVIRTDPKSIPGRFDESKMPRKNPKSSVTESGSIAIEKPTTPLAHKGMGALNKINRLNHAITRLVSTGESYHGDAVAHLEDGKVVPGADSGRSKFSPKKSTATPLRINLHSSSRPKT